MIIDGKKIAETLRQKLKKEIIEIKSSFKSVPGLTVILIGEDPASKIYVRNKEKFSKEIGIKNKNCFSSNKIPQIATKVSFENG